MGKEHTTQAIARAEVEWKEWGHLGGGDRQSVRDGYIREGGGTVNATSRALWCGWFVAWCYMEIHPELRRHLMGSTYRLRLLGSYNSDRNLWPSQGVTTEDGSTTTVKALHAFTGHLRGWVHGPACMTADIQPGDILCVRNNKKTDPPDGGHVVLCVEACPKGQPTVATICGNGLGRRSDGSTGGGVVRNDYPRGEIRQIIRPSDWDFDPSLKYAGG